MLGSKNISIDRITIDRLKVLKYVTTGISRVVVVKNAIANVVRGSATALIAIVLPPFLIRALSPDTFGVWSLILQLSSYAALLDFGIQTAVGRFVAHANELRDTQRRDQIVSTSLALLIGSSAIGLLVVGLLVWQLPAIFAQLPTELYGEARIALLIVGSSVALGLPASVFSGIFIGLQRNEIPAAIIASSRVMIALLLIVAARLTGSLVLMASVVAIVNIASYGVQWWIARHMARDVRIGRRQVARQAGREIIAYCFSLSIWSFATVLVVGLDTTLVGIFDFEAVAYYALAASLITFLSGVQNALFNTLISPAAVLDARGASAELGETLITATRYGMFVLLVVGLPLVFATAPILQVWIGSAYVAATTPLVQILVIANIIRLSAVPYAMLLIGTGQQRLVILTPFVEGGTNLLVSIIAGSLYGAIGVAAGTLVGAGASMVFHVFWNLPRTTKIACTIRSYLSQGLLRPLVCGIPFTLFWLYTLIDLSVSTMTYTVLGGMAGLTTLICVWNWGLTLHDRQRIIALIRPLRSVLSR